MHTIKVKFINMCYFMRMLKDKTYQSVLNVFYGDFKNVERIYKENDTVYTHLVKLLNTPMTPIIDNIILGNSCNACAYYDLIDVDVGAIINVSKEFSNYFQDNFKYYNIRLNDQNKEAFSIQELKQAVSFITVMSETELNEDGTPRKILIHCYMGSSRSATIVSAYLISKYNYTVDQCVEFLRSKRSLVNPNLTFIQNLQDYYDYLQKEKNRIEDAKWV